MFTNLFDRIRNKQQRHFVAFANDLSKMYKNAPIDFGGGCSYQKALALAFFIKEFNFQISVDIGVYRGRSLFPQAIAHREFSKGTVYGIDPYDSFAAVQNDSPELKKELDFFAANTDFDQIFDAINAQLEKHDLQPSVKLIRCKSHDAVHFFADNNIKLGLIHIDGNHDTFFVMQDVLDYLPLLQPDGIIVLDDISWDSVKPAYNYLAERMELIGSCIDAENDFAVFIKNGNSKQKAVSNQLFQEVIRFK